MIVDLGGGSSFEFHSSGGNQYTVSLMASKLVIIYSEYGVLQTFTRPEDVYEENLVTYFKDDSTIVKNAVIGTVGTTDKVKFKAEVERLIAAGKILEEHRDRLYAFINTTEFPPETVKKQLIIRGFGDIGEEMDFEAPSEHLVTSCALFREFLNELSKKQRSANVVQKAFEFPA